MIQGEKEIKDFVKKRYSEMARGESSCRGKATVCGHNARVSFAKIIGYTEEDLRDLPDTVIGSLAGCGNPTALASLKEGEVVLDLGSGGGIDAFLAAKKVGPKGQVIGIDMTEDMVKLASENAKKVAAKNVEFRLGEIEDLPVEDHSVDVVISNCVINLSPDKDKVFEEAFRILKPGGRMLISDIVKHGELPMGIRKSLEAWAGCVAGALGEEEYLQKISNAGFNSVEVLSRQDFMGVICSVKVRAIKSSDR